MKLLVLGLLLVSILTIDVRGADAQSPTKTLVAKSVQTDFMAHFRPAIRGTGATSWDFRDLAFSPDSTKIALSLNVDKATGKFGQLWVVKPIGDNAMLIAEEPRSTIDDVHWSPDGNRIAYIVNTTLDDGTTFRFGTALYAIEVTNHQRMLIAAADVSSVNWSPDSKGIYFFQAESVKSDASPNGYAVTWSAFMVIVRFRGRVLVSSTGWDEPGSVSPDSSMIAGLTNGGLAIEDLKDHRKRAFPGRDLFSSDGLQWSSDSKWLYVHGGGLDAPFSEVIDVTSGKVVDLKLIRDAILKLYGEVDATVFGCVWVPGRSHALLLRALVLDSANNHNMLQRPWLVYDLDTQKLEAQERLKTENDQLVPCPPKRWSNDSVYLFIAPFELYKVSVQ